MSEPTPTLADLTTFRVGGPIGRLLVPATTDALADAALATWADADDWLVVGGGSNLLAADTGFDGTVLLVATRGIDVVEDRSDAVRVRVAAGEPWDAFVATTIDRGWTGLEPLSGIPGSVGASPVQNIGAYGAEVADVLTAVEFLDEATGTRAWLDAAELELGYRSSTLKHGRRGVVLTVEFLLGRVGAGAGADAGATGVPVRYAQLASALGVDLGARVAPRAVREAVLRLRSSKGMVLDDADPDTWSAGSFFTNPIVSRELVSALPGDAPRWPVATDEADRTVPLGSAPAAPPAPATTDVKLSAAWLIEHAGVHRGFALPGSGAAVSGKHTLALTNRGSATAAEIAELARYVQTMVLTRFGVGLVPEPVLVGF